VYVQAGRRGGKPRRMFKRERATAAVRASFAAEAATGKGSGSRTQARTGESIVHGKKARKRVRGVGRYCSQVAVAGSVGNR